MLPSLGKVANFRRRLRGQNEPMQADQSKLDVDENDLRDKVDVLLNRLGYVNKKIRLEQELNRHINQVVDERKQTRLEKRRQKREEIRIRQENEMAEIEQEVEAMLNSSRQEVDEKQVDGDEASDGDTNE